MICVCLLQIFTDAWRHRELQPQLSKLLGMWNGIFPQQLLDRMHQVVKQNSPAHMSGRQHIAPQSSAQAQTVQQYAGQWRPPAEAPAVQAVPSYPGFGTSTSAGGQFTAAQQPVYATLRSNIPASAQHGALTNGYAHPVRQAVPVQPGWQQQAVHSTHYTQAPMQPSSQPMVLPNLLTSLLSSGLLSVQQPVSFASAAPFAAAPAVSYTHPPSRLGTPEAVNPEDCKFVPSRLKVLSWLSFSLMHACTVHLQVTVCCCPSFACSLFAPM